MRALIPILISFALPLQSHGIAGTDTVVTAYPQAPEFLETAGTTFAMTEEEYRNVAEGLSKSSWFVAIKNHPKNLTAHARYGYNLAFGGINHCWILDGDEKQGYVLYPDLNANGNPADDSTLRFTLDQGRYAIRLQTTAAETTGDSTEKYPVELKLEITHATPPGKTEPLLALNIYSSTRRRGQLRVGDRTLGFALMGSQGIYNRRFDRVFFDLNGDDKPSSLETYKVWEKYVNMGETTYEFEVQRYGQSLTLRPTAMHLPARQSLEQGSLMPDFSIKDISGVVHRSSDFRGNVLLLDFWGTWCAPCVAEAPTLSAIYKRFHERGLEIFGIHNGLDTDSVKAFIAKYDMHWTHALETEDGTLHRMFRIQGWPTYYLIGRDGTILSGDLRPGDKLIGEIETLLKQK